MPMLPRRTLLLSAPLFLLAACGAQESYELRWSITCPSTTGGQPAACQIKTAKDCADAGFDAVQVIAVRGAQRKGSLFPCFGQLGPVGRGPGLDQGPINLEVSALSPGGQHLAGPVVVPTIIPKTGLVTVEVTLPRPPECGDGVDNDGDGLVDMLDPGCQACGDGVDNDGDGLIDMLDPDCDGTRE